MGIPKLVIISILLVFCISLTSCAYYKNTLVQIKADEVEIESLIPEIPHISGKGINGTINRGVYLGSSKTIQSLPDVSIKHSLNGGSVVDSTVIRGKK